MVKVNQEKFVKYLEETFKIKEAKDWYKIPPRQIQEAGGSGIIKKMGGLQEFLIKMFPSHQWDKDLFEATRKRASQRWLRVLVEEFLPNSGMNE